MVFVRFNLDFLYTTITMGVDPGYVKENFYDKVNTIASVGHGVNV